LHPRGRLRHHQPLELPLAIFTGQLAAALARQRVVAKPAEATSLTAAAVVDLLPQRRRAEGRARAGPGRGRGRRAGAGGRPAHAGVAFTGGTETGWAINRAMAAAPHAIRPFIAETGGPERDDRRQLGAP
jgi:RHH-type proline utilization regulon transcriptional repressor/proline dehydrogenase/delta 1-pyrroline-5-carboxylate dehydrogenase